jgi:hypothetical protein
LKKYLKDETGSISLLIIFLFITTVILSLIVIDVSDAYLAKRQLAQIGEAAAEVGTHQIDLPKYYSQGLIDSGLGYQQVPIDCGSALSYAQKFLLANSLRGNQINLARFNCTNEQITLNLTSRIRPVIDLPIVLGSFGNNFEINARVTATSVVR